MTTYFAKLLFDGQTWCHNCLFEVDPQGIIYSFTPDIDKESIDLNSSDITVLKAPVFPLMPNVHSHAFQRAMAGEAEQMTAQGKDSFWTWRKLMYDFAGRLTPEDTYIIARWLYIEMLKNGYGWVGEFQYLHHSPDGTPYENRAEMAIALMHAAQDAHIGMTMLPALYSYSNFGEAVPDDGQKRFLNNEEDYAKIVEACQNEATEMEAMEIGLCFHSLRATSKTQRTELTRSFKGLPVHIHVAEQIKEVEDCLAHTKMRPVEYLFDTIAVDDNWTLIHATHIEENEITMIAQSAAVAGLCPTTEANLGDGIFPLQAYMSQNGHIAIGSDSNISSDMVDELRALEYAQRLSSQKRSICTSAASPSPATTLFAACLKGGAKSMNSPMDILGNGARADFFTLNLNHSCFYGAEDRNEALLDRFIFGRSGGQNVVNDVYMSGQKIVTNGYHIREDRARADYKKVMEKLYS